MLLIMLLLLIDSRGIKRLERLIDRRTGEGGEGALEEEEGEEEEQVTPSVLCKKRSLHEK